MRRRLRRQRQMREALLLDLGALVFELHRQSRREPELLQAKAAELTAVDQEVRALADALDADGSMLQLVAAGIAGTCSQCGSLLSTDARYCQACGQPAVPALARERQAEDRETLAPGIGEEPAPEESAGAEQPMPGAAPAIAHDESVEVATAAEPQPEAPEDEPEARAPEEDPEAGADEPPIPGGSAFGDLSARLRRLRGEG